MNIGEYINYYAFNGKRIDNFYLNIPHIDLFSKGNYFEYSYNGNKIAMTFSINSNNEMSNIKIINFDGSVIRIPHKILIGTWMDYQYLKRVFETNENYVKRRS